MEWLFVGSSPSALTWYPRVYREGIRTITCNGGIGLCPTPDVYLCCDQFASRNYSEPAKLAQQAGTHLVTLKRSEAALLARNVHWYDEFLELPGHADIERGTYGRFQYSGPLCVQYACIHGATVVHLVGSDGYTKPNDYWDAEVRQGAGWKTQDLQGCRNITNNALAPAFRRIAEVYHDVMFWQYGNPSFSVSGFANWEVIDGDDSDSCEGREQGAEE